MSEGQIALMISGLSFLVTISIAIAAWRSASSSQNSVQATKDATHAQLYVQLMKEYASPDMKNSLETLRRYKRNTVGSFAESWIKQLEQKIKHAEEVDNARRYVKYYFLNINKLDKQEFIPEGIIKSLLSVAGVNILFEIVEKLEEAKNSQFDHSDFERLRKRLVELGIEE